MSTSDFPPYLQHLLQFPSFPVHSGLATIECIGDPSRPFSQFVRHLRDHFGDSKLELADVPLPALVFSTIAGRCLVAVRGERSLFSRNFGTNLRVHGEVEGREFSFHAPKFYCRRSTGWGKGEDWVLFEPLNEPATLHYLPSAPTAEVSVLQLNFSVRPDSGNTDPPLTVSAAGRTVTFRPTPRCGDVVRLLEVDTFDSAPTTEVRFSPWPGSSDGDLTHFAWNVSRFCGLVAQQQTNPVQLTLIGKDGLPARTEFYSPMRSSFRDLYLLPGLDFPASGLAQFFTDCFDEYLKLRDDSAWGRLFNTAWCYEDGVYLENRACTLLGAIELLIRTSLIEGNHCSPGRCKKMHLPELIEAAQNRLGWPIPDHYIDPDRYRDLRNATAHAMPLPCSPREVVDLIQKWGLFLYRRLFIRLGYKGQMRSANKGYSSFSDVSDFSEDQNSFACGE